MTTCLRRSVADVVRRQAAAGVDVVSDGEFGKSISWSQYALERSERLRAPAGQAGRQSVPARRRSRALRRVLCRARCARRAWRHGTDSVCVGPITYTGQAELQRDIDNFKAALAGVAVEEAFLPVAAPASVIPDRKNEYYRSDEECLRAPSARRCAPNTSMIVDAGFVLQLDDARAAVTYDRMVPPASFADYRKWVALHMEVLNHAIEGIAAGSYPLSRLLGQLAGAAHHRRTAARTSSISSSRCRSAPT